MEILQPENLQQQPENLEMLQQQPENLETSQQHPGIHACHRNRKEPGPPQGGPATLAAFTKFRKPIRQSLKRNLRLKQRSERPKSQVEEGGGGPRTPHARLSPEAPPRCGETPRTSRGGEKMRRQKSTKRHKAPRPAYPAPPLCLASTTGDKAGRIGAGMAANMTKNFPLRQPP